MYPVRGLLGMEVKNLHILEGGALLDREWMIIRVKRNGDEVTYTRACLCATDEVTDLQQELIYDELPGDEF